MTTENKSVWLTVKPWQDIKENKTIKQNLFPKTLLKKKDCLKILTDAERYPRGADKIRILKTPPKPHSYSNRCSARNAYTIYYYPG
jgi:hypothetical protein